MLTWEKILQDVSEVAINSSSSKLWTIIDKFEYVEEAYKNNPRLYREQFCRAAKALKTAYSIYC